MLSPALALEAAWKDSLTHFAFVPWGNKRCPFMPNYAHVIVRIFSKFTLDLGFKSPSSHSRHQVFSEPYGFLFPVFCCCDAGVVSYQESTFSRPQQARTRR